MNFLLKFQKKRSKLIEKKNRNRDKTILLYRNFFHFLENLTY
jgi:hypothetical protein